MNHVEVTVKGVVYRLGKISPMDQLPIVLKLSPLLPPLIPLLYQTAEAELLKQKQAEGNDSVDLTMGDALKSIATNPKLLEAFGGFTGQLAKLDPADCAVINATCLAVVYRKTDNKGWIPVWNRNNQVLMYEDIDLSTILALVTRVIQENLGPFFQEFLISQGNPLALVESN
jgi:hypothetical protein